MGTSHGPSFGEKSSTFRSWMPGWVKSWASRHKAKRNWAKHGQPVVLPVLLGWPREIHGQKQSKSRGHPYPTPNFWMPRSWGKTTMSCWSCLIVSLPYRQKFPRSDRLNRFQACYNIVGAFKNWVLMVLYVSGSWNLVWMLETSRFFEPSKISKGFFGWARNGLRLSESTIWRARDKVYRQKCIWAVGKFDERIPGPVLGLQAPSGRFQRQEKAKV